MRKMCIRKQMRFNMTVTMVPETKQSSYGLGKYNYGMCLGNFMHASNAYSVFRKVGHEMTNHIASK